MEEREWELKSRQDAAHTMEREAAVATERAKQGWSDLEDAKNRLRVEEARMEERRVEGTTRQAALDALQARCADKEEKLEEEASPFTMLYL